MIISRIISSDPELVVLALERAGFHAKIVPLLNNIDAVDTHARREEIGHALHYFAYDDIGEVISIDWRHQDRRVAA